MIPGARSLEQWLEYCPGGKKKRTCPVCKQPCGAAHPPTRLYFQSTGACPTQAEPASQDAPAGPDPEALAAELARLEQKAASLGKVVEEQRDGIKNLNAEASAAAVPSRSVFLGSVSRGLLMGSCRVSARLPGGWRRRPPQRRCRKPRERRKTMSRCYSLREKR